MLRNDGKYEIFILEAKKDSGECWFATDGGGFKCRKRWHKDGSGKEYEPYESFSASGKCWQETGVHATYDVEQAIKLYHIMVEDNPEYIFRVIKKTICQDSEVLWCG